MEQFLWEHRPNLQKSSLILAVMNCGFLPATVPPVQMAIIALTLPTRPLSLTLISEEALSMVLGKLPVSME